MKVHLVSFLAGAVAGLLAHAWTVSRKLAELREAVYLLSPPFSRRP